MQNAVYASRFLKGSHSQSNEVMIMETTEELIARLTQENQVLKSTAGPAPKERTSRPTREAKVHNWTATIFDSKDIIQTKVNSKGKVEQITKGFEKCQQADQWACLRLCDGSSDWYAIVESGSMPIATKITREEAMGRIMGRLPGKGSPVTQGKGKGGGSLGFGVKVHQTRVAFSHG
jgi:hypothetical protein